MAFTFVTITRDYDLADGVDPVGEVSFTPTVPMTNGPTVVAAPVVRTLDIDGILSIPLAANTDPATTPAGSSYLVRELIAGVSRSYYVQIPHTAGSTIDLSTLVTAPIPPVVTYPATAVQDEGSAVTQRPTINFVGAGVSVADDPANTRTNVTIASGGGVDSPIHSGNALTGVTGNNSTDNSTPFLNAFSTVAGGIQNYSTLSTNRQGTKTIELPPGAFVVTSADALMRDLGIPRTAGLTIRGAGRDLTKLVFSPTVANSYLLTNNEDFYHITFEDLTFHSTVASASFMHSTSTGGPQNYVFNRCNWRGSWTYGLNLDGDNVNSEMTWFHCGIYDAWTAFLYVGSGGSDQFVNYNFFACQVEYDTGNFVDMTKGGNINVWGGSLIHRGNATATTSSAQCFFRLRTGDHAGGTERLKVVGARVEHRHTASQLINSDWKRGVVSFDNVHTDATAFIAGNEASVVSCEFGGGGNEISAISFRDSLLLGKHKYHYTTNSATYPKRITYDNCKIQTFGTAATFTTFTNDDASGNVASAPQVEFRNCKGNDETETTFDCTLNWHVGSPGRPRTYIVSMKRFIGTLPFSGSALTEMLPINSVITRVRSGKGVIGSSTSTNFTYTLTDGAGATIATAAGNGSTTWANGYNYDSGPLSRYCNTDAERTLTVTSANITEGTTESFFWVEYLA